MLKNHMRAVFLSQFKLGWKAAETARDINNAFGLEHTKEHTEQCSSRNSAPAREAWIGWKGRQSDVENDQLGALLEANSRTLAENYVCTRRFKNHLQELGK